MVMCQRFCHPFCQNEFKINYYFNKHGNMISLKVKHLFYICDINDNCPFLHNNK